MIPTLLLAISWAATLLGANPVGPEVPTRGEEVSFEEVQLPSPPEGFVISGDVVWSPNGRRAAYIAFKDGETYAAYDGEVFDSFKFLGRPTFSDDSEHVVFRAGESKSKTKESWWPYLDGKKGKKQDWIGLVYFRPGSDELVYWTQPGAKLGEDGFYKPGSMILVTGKKKGKKWEDAGSLFPIAFSADGAIAATTVKRGYTWHVLLAGKKQEVAKEGAMMMKQVALSPSGDRWAADVTELPKFEAGGSGREPGSFPKSKARILTENGYVGEQYDEVAEAVFSADGKDIAFVYGKNEKMGLATAKGIETKAEFDFVSKGIFDPGGQGVAFMANMGGKLDPVLRFYMGAWGMILGGTEVLVHLNNDGKETFRSAPYGEIRSVAFSPRDGSLAFSAKTEDGWIVVWGDQKSAAYEQVGELHFDEQGGRLAFGTRTRLEIHWRVMEPAQEGAVESE
jgi:hypothetical protein